MTITLRAALADLFIDPISYVPMTDPVTNANKKCGHTFQKEEIEGWRAVNIAEGRIPQCPLCREPITELVQNLFMRQALEILNAPEHVQLGNVEDLTEEEKNQVQKVVAAMRSVRAAGEANRIPDRLPEPQTFRQKAVATVKDFYKC